MRLSNIRKLVSDDEAVSPVIGVILMVAITVILAAVIGTFVLGLGDDVTDSTAPTADFNFESETEDGSVTEVTVTHAGGDTISASELTAAGSAVEGPDDEEDEDLFGDEDDVTAGTDDTLEADEEDDVRLTSGADAGSTVQVVWNADGADSSQTLASYEIPEGVENGE